jgi:flagellar biosynthetic protein FliP
MKVLVAMFVIAIAMISPDAALAQALKLSDFISTGDAPTTGRIVQMIVAITLLSVAPGLLMMVTCFTRFIIVFSFLRFGLGLQTTPSNLILISLALFLTSFVMAPTFEKSWETGLQPLLEKKLTEEVALPRMTQPFKEFMQVNVRPQDLRTFAELGGPRLKLAEGQARDDLRILIPAFMVSELKRGFEIGFLIVLPFLVIDLIVATVLMAMGMMMMPPTPFALPMKVLFFVLIDGWTLLVGGLVRSFA